MLSWARANPLAARAGLRFVARLVIAVILVLPLQALSTRFGMPADYGLFVAVVLALLVGGRIANQQADRWGIPSEIGG
jgi:hypothetical protein